jgi:hypothetical protein
MKPLRSWLVLALSLFGVTGEPTPSQQKRERETVPHRCLNDGTEIFTGNLDDGKKHVFSGRVRDLKIGGKVDGSSELDVTALECGDVTITGKIDGKGVARIFVKGHVTVGGEINGGSQVTIVTRGNVKIGGQINNPRTRVEIKTNGDVEIGGDIDGGSAIIVNRCRNFRFTGGKVDNPDTRIIVNHTGLWNVPPDRIKNGTVAHTRLP